MVIARKPFIDFNEKSIKHIVWLMMGVLGICRLEGRHSTRLVKGAVVRGGPWALNGFPPIRQVGLLPSKQRSNSLDSYKWIYSRSASHCASVRPLCLYVAYVISFYNVRSVMDRAGFTRAEASPGSLYWWMPFTPPARLAIMHHA